MEDSEKKNILDPIDTGNNIALLPIENLIHMIRGQQVMIDSDLARLYGVETRALNQAVKRNIERFPTDFMFRLDKEESQNLISQLKTSGSRSQNVTLNVERGKNDRFLIIDDTVYFIGGSIKDLGKKIVAFSQMHQNPDNILARLR